MIRATIRGMTLILALALLASSAGAQTLDEVLAKHAAAHGGLERWRGVHALIVTGTEVIFSNSVPFVYEWQRPDSIRLEHSILGQTVTVVHNGSATRWTNPILGIAQPTDVPEAEAALARRAFELESPLVDATAKGNKVELLGKDEVDGQPALKLKVTRKDGAVETWYLDPASHLELARFDRTLDIPEVQDRWTWFSDFRAVEGLVIPHRQDQEYSIRHVSFTIEKVRVNPEIEAGRFEMNASR